ncbi:hypothetical protein AB0O64_07270 [Streptomyces sp. NPDC088341]|uniref:hypothetical protein n=1 Tax=Streptomyces sp. NPDC088341 TaxID=3154870 RepID=UPI003419F091
MLVEIHLGQHFLFPGVAGEGESEPSVDLRFVLPVGLVYGGGEVADGADEAGDVVT